MGNPGEEEYLMDGRRAFVRKTGLLGCTMAAAATAGATAKGTCEDTP